MLKLCGITLSNKILPNDTYTYAWEYGGTHGMYTMWQKSCAPQNPQGKPLIRSDLFIES